MNSVMRSNEASTNKTVANNYGRKREEDTRGPQIYSGSSGQHHQRSSIPHPSPQRLWIEEWFPKSIRQNTGYVDVMQTKRPTYLDNDEGSETSVRLLISSHPRIMSFMPQSTLD